MAELISPFDPLDRLEPGERRFVLREHDRAAPAAITEWCRTRRNLALKLYGTHPTGDAERALNAELLQCAEAEAIALDWAAAGVDAEVAVRATYSNVALTEEQAKAAARQRDLTETRRHLREAAYHLNNVIEVDGPEASTGMKVALVTANAMADMLDKVPA